MPVDLQSFSETIYEGLEEGFVVGNGLEYVSICRHIADGPLAQPCTAQSEDVTGEVDMRKINDYQMLPYWKKKQIKVETINGSCKQNVFFHYRDLFTTQAKWK